MEIIPQDRVAVIGMRALHEEDANTAFAETVSLGKLTAETMYEFLIAAIQAQNEIGVQDQTCEQLGNPQGMLFLSDQGLLYSSGNFRQQRTLLQSAPWTPSAPGYCFDEIFIYQFYD